MAPDDQQRREIDPERLPTELAANPDLAPLRDAAQGMPVYVVGGSVRDLLLGSGHKAQDLDIVIEGEIGPLAERLSGRIVEHERFRTATVELRSGTVDIAQARSETYAQPGALPDVEPASIEEDLARRDFSINAMAVPLLGRGGLIDPHGGLEDLRAGMLRVLHDGSFVDDPTRALRAARYASRLGFELEPRTAELIGQADLSTVSEDRVVAELGRVITEEDPRAALELIDEWGVMDLGSGPRLVAALERVFDADPEWEEFADRDMALLLAVAPGDHPGRLRHRAARLAKHAEPTSPAEVQVLAHGHLPEILAMSRAAGSAWLDDYVHRLRHVELEITGDDLIDEGIPEGPAVGTGLNAALTARLNNEVDGFEDELRIALEAADQALGPLPDEPTPD
jgi:tRNA nucleotidyltransferase (CCA-adding enzyme)